MYVTADTYSDKKVVFKDIIKKTKPVPYQRIPAVTAPTSIATEMGIPTTVSMVPRPVAPNPIIAMTSPCCIV